MFKNNNKRELFIIFCKLAKSMRKIATSVKLTGFSETNLNQNEAVI